MPAAEITLFGCRMLFVAEDAYLLMESSPRPVAFKLPDLLRLATAYPNATLFCVTTGVGRYDVRLRIGDGVGGEGQSVAPMIAAWHNPTASQPCRPRFRDGDSVNLDPANLDVREPVPEHSHAG